MNEKKYEIPMFSARAARRMGTGVMIFAVLFLFFDLIGIESGKTAVLVSVVIFIILYGCLSHIMKRCVWKLQEDCIKEIGIGGGRDIPYEEIREALLRRKIKITTSSFKVPKKRGYISFHYEVGNAKLQKEIKESYRFLAEKVPAEFPKLTKTVIQQMDRRFFYRKDRRNSSIVMILSSFVMLLYDVGPVIWCVIVVGLGQVVQYLMLDSLFRGIYFGKKVEEKIQKAFAGYVNIKLCKVWISYVQMTTVVLLTALMNLFMLSI